MNTLAFGYILPTTGRIPDFHRLETCAAGRTEKAAEARLLLSSIPKDASVKSTTFFIPQLSGRDEIYLADSRHPADYIVLDQRPGYGKDSHALMAKYLDHGYGAWGDVDGYVTVLVSPQ